MTAADHAQWGFPTSTGLAFTRADIVDAHFDACLPTYLELVRAAGFRPGQHVLDAGSGGGRFLPHLAGLVGPGGRLTALDLAAENVALIRERWPTLADAWQGDLLALPFPDDEFDAAWCANTVQYLDDEQLRTALAELRRVVKPGGLVAVKDLDASAITVHPGPRFLVTDFFRRAALHSGYAHNLLRTRDLHLFLKEAGFSDVWQQTRISEHFAPFTAAEREFYTRSCASLAAQAGDDPHWTPFLDVGDRRNPLNAPDAYIAEGAVLAVGRVPR
ncbi:methyltransferase domain-containing protein [Saccharothrix sp. 6-C]|uniref:Methyltransferase family protein n=1 Tax=Saccharothrix texasensis TaxID=103734 RepID=A0A3N1H1Z0_9PSEU|nr:MULTISPECIES: methyltransferase domain-containing protein [Saccharothrix]QQQ78749.1 methyltransferase domain-containing protein [Saccharothrix sp. 6-C]ROP36555.1 methyltransferase family protein [Saccharothrix texasensis]